MRVVIFLLFFYSLALALTPDMAAKNHATYYKKKLPFICTPTLTLNDILNVGDTLIYRYAVKHARKQEIKRLEEKELLEFIEAIKKENLRTACKDKEILSMLSIGVTLDELFYSENGELIFEYTIEDRDCKKLQ
ncbi:flagellar protein FlaH [Campylobacter concisus]|uniref:flagellar protein FlaH n=1 Tax=Campylobacter concisus TaxID=199 RepID=UPI000B3D73E4|nr:flagellar protein FlaH [Campylobacter concisus]OUT14593.1 flagellar protein FlaH [Campylobacter concisus]